MEVIVVVIVEVVIGVVVNIVEVVVVVVVVVAIIVVVTVVLKTFIIYKESLNSRTCKRVRKSLSAVKLINCIADRMVSHLTIKTFIGAEIILKSMQKYIVSLFMKKRSISLWVNLNFG